MSTTRKDSSLRFSLKELKDLTADLPDVAPAKPTRKANALEGADDLLGDIRGLIGSAAEEEAAALQAKKEAERRAQEAELLRTQSAQKAEIEARIAAERARQQAVEEERAARQRAIDIAEGRIVPEPERPAAAARPMMQQPAVLQPTAPKGRGTGFYLAVVGLPLLSITAVVIALILKPTPPAPEPMTQPMVQEVVAKAPAPVVPDTKPVNLGFEEIEEPPEVEEPKPKVEKKLTAKEKRALAKAKARARARAKARAKAKKNEGKLIIDGLGGF